MQDKQECFSFGSIVDGLFLIRFARRGVDEIFTSFEFLYYAFCHLEWYIEGLFGIVLFYV